MKLNVCDFRINLGKATFDFFGLDPELNMLCAPECECGCGGKMNIVLEDAEAIKDFCGSIAADADLDYCAVFALTASDEMYAAIRDEDEVLIVKKDDISSDYDFMKDTVYDFDLDAFGLLVEVEDGLFKIIEE